MSDSIQTTNFKNLESCLSLEQTDWCGQKLNKFFTVKQSVPLKAAREYRAVLSVVAVGKSGSHTGGLCSQVEICEQKPVDDTGSNLTTK